MAMAALRSVPFHASIPLFSLDRPKAFRVWFGRRNGGDETSSVTLRSSLHFSRTSSLRFLKFVVGFASETEATEIKPEIEESSDCGVDLVDSSNDALESVQSDGSKDNVEEEPVSPVITSLKIYREALLSGDEAKLSEVTSFLKSLEDEKLGLERKLVTLSEELSTEKDRVLRISADFENFRKRTERERSLLVINSQAEVVEKLLGVLDNFERAKEQIKVENEREEKINNSYQSIFKQFNEILTSLGVVPVETVGHPFDPLLHEAIMREDSTEFEEGIILQEFRKGFMIGDRLLRPSMVKVSAGPGPAKPGQEVERELNVTESAEKESGEAESA